MFDLKDLAITMANKKIIDVEHDEFQTELIPIDNTKRQQIIYQIVQYVTGSQKKLYIWSDYDAEEPSTDCYLAVKCNTGAMLQELIEDLDTLVKYLNDSTYDIYRLRVEDNLI